MKIALITIHNANNYGAILQAYATKKILSQYGSVSTINYVNPYLAYHLDLVRFRWSKHGIKMALHDTLRIYFRYRAINKFKNFLHTSMNLTYPMTREDIINNRLNDFDVYVCGSDQIWNPDIVSAEKKIDTTYFLDFAPGDAKKISYASSAGAHIYTGPEAEQVKNLLHDFEMISVREKGTMAMLETLLKRRIYHVVDPTLLLSKNDWVKSFGIELDNRQGIPKHKYMLLYSVPKTPLVRKAVDYFARKLNLKVVALDQGLNPPAKVDVHIKDAGPKEFIKLFLNAENIVTDSFHGVCFSVNFGKQFIAVSPKGRANRTESFLAMLDLEEKLVDTEEQFRTFNFDIEFNRIEPKLIELRNNALRILSLSLKNEKTV